MTIGEKSDFRDNSKRSITFPKNIFKNNIMHIYFQKNESTAHFGPLAPPSRSPTSFDRLLSKGGMEGFSNSKRSTGVMSGLPDDPLVPGGDPLLCPCQFRLPLQGDVWFTSRQLSQTVDFDGLADGIAAWPALARPGRQPNTPSWMTSGPAIGTALTDRARTERIHLSLRPRGG